MPERPAVLRASIRRSPTGALSLALNDMPLHEQPHLAAAVNHLCMEAIDRAQTIVVTINSGGGRRYLTIGPDGDVSSAAPPAPDTATTVVQHESVDLGSSPDDAETSRLWVEGFIMDPDAAEPDEHEPVKRKRRFRRKAD